MLHTNQKPPLYNHVIPDTPISCLIVIISIMMAHVTVRISDLHISKFDNARAIHSLPVCPFSVAERDGMVDSEKLAKRGREFIRCTQSCHLHYSGRSQIRQPWGDYLSHQSNNYSGRVSRVFSENINSEVMIEYDRALQRNPE